MIKNPKYLSNKELVDRFEIYCLVNNTTIDKLLIRKQDLKNEIMKRLEEV